ncbi:signal peptidase I [Neobacillus sp. MM2021_6]|uniref:signal peptidase I n=1 Tax=Bacillaceae TaxID=186817 RepID=UPI001407E5A3|nr:MULTISPECIES: signal peptidase I [Bacillaceae]MBO0962182.1 signal peptidase I [Neobacillus sp. MM2021_6]NHC19038.1 signal peptidase I [Bacillus sp. MM2020_4]
MLIDHNTFTLLKSTIKKDGWLGLPAYGNSMFPYIRQGDLCRFIPCEPLHLKKGDVILFYAQADQLIAHRFVKIKRIDDQLLFLLKGDTNLGFDQPIGKDRILGKLDSIQRQHKKVTPDHFFAFIWGKLILTFPILSGILRKYLNRKYKVQY